MPVSRELITGRRWTAATKLDLDKRSIATWDPTLDRDVRLLVPIDVQALVVPKAGREPMVRLPSALNDPTGQGQGFPPPFDAGRVREPGVHLHWAMPDALLRGTLGSGEHGTGLAMRPLPDRWVVLRLLAPAGASTAAVRGWVIEAEAARVTALADWPAGAGTSTPLGAPVEPAALTGTAGGSIAWAATYDSVVGRFALHDPLDDLSSSAPDGIEGAATYVVAGWWSDAQHDPLDDARDRGSLDDLLGALGWTAVAQWQDAGADQRARDTLVKSRRSANLVTKQVVPDAPPTVTPTTNALVTHLDATASHHFVVAGGAAFQYRPWWPHACLLHGSVYGVPVESAAADPASLDNRPDPATVEIGLGAHDDDVIGALVSHSLAPTSDESRRDTERLLSAFTGQLLRELDAPDGAVAIEEHEHQAAFGSLPGGSRGTDRLLAGQSRTSRTTGRGARRADDLMTSKHGIEERLAGVKEARATALFRDRRQLLESAAIVDVISKEEAATNPEAAVSPEPRVVEKQAPRFHFPLDPLVAVRGARRSLRHGNDGRFSDDGLMWCRWPYQTQRRWKGIVDGADVVPTLGNGAIPDEILLLAQEAVISSPYHRRWLGALAGQRTGLPPGAIARRFDGEAALRYGAAAVYDGRTTVLGAGERPDHDRRDIFDQLLNHSQLEGAEPYPLGVTMWSQPWVPMWLEWEVDVDVSATLDGWELATVDLATVGATPPSGGASTRYTGRTLLTVGAARTLGSAVTDFLAAEDALEKATGGLGELDEETERALAAIATASELLDLQTAELDGLRLAWLGVPATVDGVQRLRASDGTPRPPAPTGPPTPLVSGELALRRLRLVDTFGRTLDLGSALDRVVVAVRNDVPGDPGALALVPRLPRPARWMFRLVDAATAAGAEGAEALVDQVDPKAQVNPVAGFVLPDHLDESLELFDVAGNPIGELFHGPIGGRVVWEIAPGRTGPPDSGPLFELRPEHRALGRIAGGLVTADVHARDSDAPVTETALSAALRAIDTTLWTVDTFAGMGSEHIAGLVGRPIAVVRAQLWLELQPEDGLDLSDPARAAERAAAEEALAAVAFPVRLGELTRQDDGLLGFFVGDDYEHFHVVDRTVLQMAKPAGPTGQREAAAPIEHPYLVAEDTLHVHHGQRLTLTLLMHPAGRVHLSSGVLPRKSLELARDWVAPGLAALSPSLRTGPLLIDPEEVRLPKPRVFGANQRFTRRTSPTEWRDDPILAATQTALLPDGATSVQDGYIRVMPDPDGDA